MTDPGDDYVALREQLKRDTCKAFGVKPWQAGLAPVPLWARLWRKVTPFRRRVRARTALEDSFRSWDRASAKARELEAAYVAALPESTAAITREVNEKLAGVLPEGMKFEWVTRGE